MDISDTVCFKVFIQQLKPKQQLVVELRLQRFSYREIEDKTGLKSSYCRKIMHDALVKMKGECDGSKPKRTN